MRRPSARPSPFLLCAAVRAVEIDGIMRSVVVFLRDTTAEAVARLLDQLCPAQKGPPWIWEHDREPCLYVQCEPGGAFDFGFERDVRESVVAALGGDPQVSLLVDVSGRHPGDAEVRELLSAVLGTFHGVAQDDNTSHSWTLEEVRSGATARGHTFFDYQGRAKQRGSK